LHKEAPNSDRGKDRQHQGENLKHGTSTRRKTLIRTNASFLNSGSAGRRAFLVFSDFFHQSVSIDPNSIDLPW
jgi:hypothetical protein